MNYVQPIKDIRDINRMKSYLSERSNRDYFLFVLGINIGFRISDILPLHVKDLQGEYITVKEEKTGKLKRFKINNQLRLDINKYIDGKESNTLLFASRKGQKPITRIQAYNILNTAGQSVGLENIGTHTLRKTFGYHHYQRHKDVAILQDIFNHSSPSITLRYIGISQDEIDATLTDFYL